MRHELESVRDNAYGYERETIKDGKKKTRIFSKNSLRPKFRQLL